MLQGSLAPGLKQDASSSLSWRPPSTWPQCCRLRLLWLFTETLCKERGACGCRVVRACKNSDQWRERRARMRDSSATNRVKDSQAYPRDWQGSIPETPRHHIAGNLGMQAILLRASAFARPGQLYYFSSHTQPTNQGTHQGINQPRCPWLCPQPAKPTCSDFPAMWSPPLPSLYPKHQPAWHAKAFFPQESSSNTLHNAFMHPIPWAALHP